LGMEETTRFKSGHPEPETCAACLHRNIKIRDQAPLAGCGDYQVWTQIDDPNADPAKCFFPQVDSVDALHKHYPDAVYLLPQRDTEDWIRSVENAFHNDEEMGSNTSMADRIRRCPFTTRVPAGNLRQRVCPSPPRPHEAMGTRAQGYLDRVRHTRASPSARLFQ